MSKRKREEDDDYKVLRIVDAISSINQKVNLIGVVIETGISKQSKGTDCCCTLKIIDESIPNSGISVNFFAEDFEKLPHAESAGDIIQLSRVVMKNHWSGVNAVFDKKNSSFALYDGRIGSKVVPYQVSSNFQAREQDKKLIAHLRNWTVTHQPEIASSGCLTLQDIKQGHQCNLICKVLHVSEVSKGEWMIYAWDGTDVPPVNIDTKLEEELKNPVPLQLEATPLSRAVFRTFPTVGTVLRMTAGSCNEKLGLPLLKAGTWVQFRNVNFESRFGIWCGVLVPKSRFIYLANDDDLVLKIQRRYDERLKSKSGRLPNSCFPWPSYVTETDHEDAPFCTLMDMLCFRKVTYKFKCVVRVVATMPGHPKDFRASCGTLRFRLTLEDPTARVDAFVYAEDGVKFFGGEADPCIDAMVKLQKALLGVEETDDGVLREKGRNPPWVQCCIKSYYIDEKDKWGSRRYRIFGTTLMGLD